MSALDTSSHSQQSAGSGRASFGNKLGSLARGILDLGGRGRASLDSSTHSASGARSRISADRISMDGSNHSKADSVDSEKSSRGSISWPLSPLCRMSSGISPMLAARGGQAAKRGIGIMSLRSRPQILPEYPSSAHDGGRMPSCCNMVSDSMSAAKLQAQEEQAKLFDNVQHIGKLHGLEQEYLGAWMDEHPQYKQLSAEQKVQRQQLVQHLYESRFAS